MVTMGVIPAIFLIVASACVLAIIVLKVVLAKKTESKFVMTIIGLAVMLCGFVVTLIIGKTEILLYTVVAFSLFVLIQSIIDIVNAKITSEAEEDDVNFSVFEKLISENQDEQVIRDMEKDFVSNKVVDQFIDSGKDYFIQAADSFSNESGLSSLLNYINADWIEKTNADGGAILLLDDFEDIIYVKSFEGIFPPPYKLPEDLPHKEKRIHASFKYAQFNLEDNIFGLVASSGKPELIVDSSNDSRIFENGSEDFLKPGSYIFVPLKLKETIIGVICVARKAESEPFTEKEFEIAKALSIFAGTAINSIYSFNQIKEHSELTKEYDLVCELQKKLPPKKLPVIDTLSLGVYYNTAEGICGDYYDIIPARKDRTSFVLADVAGKGMKSYTVMVMLRAILRLVVNTTKTAATILSWANRGISNENSIDHFASLALINYDKVNKKIQFATAGTTPIYFYKSETKKFSKVSILSEPIGVEKTTEYKDCELDVSSGDIIVTCSDGLVETINNSGKTYTANRLINLITDNCTLSGKEIANIVKADIKAFTDNARQHDDQSLLVIKIQ